jgi:hypothetical protein
MSAGTTGAIATLETRHWSFEAHGLDEAGAREAMSRLLAEHGRQCSLPSDWSKEYEVAVREFAPGTGCRDGMVVTR